MPYVFVLKRGVGAQAGQVLWRCCLNSTGTAPNCGGCQQCRAYKLSDRSRCRARTCFGSLCHTHLRKRFFERPDDPDDAAVEVGVRIGPSTIANAGRGLFATRDMKFNTPIMAFEYDVLTADELRERYDYDDPQGNRVVGVAPYGFTVSVARNEHGDAACHRNAPSFANQNRQNAARTNARIQPSEHGVWLYTKRGTAAQNRPTSKAIAIRAGEEIFINYGAQYWQALRNVSYDLKQVRKSANPAGGAAIGRVVR
jgi:hypothetical protein